MTSEKQKEWARRYYQRHRESVLKRNRAYQQAHRITEEQRIERNAKQRLRYRNDDEYREAQKQQARDYYKRKKESKCAI